VPSAGLEPALPKRARILSPLCLPIPPRGLLFKTLLKDTRLVHYIFLMVNY